jgi:hypothetical protein
MKDEIQAGCKKCGSVITIETRASRREYLIRVEDATMEERRDVTRIVCKKCGKPVFVVSIEPV